MTRTVLTVYRWLCTPKAALAGMREQSMIDTTTLTETTRHRLMIGDTDT